MNILFVTAISEPKSFGAKLVKASAQKLCNDGHKVEKSDLFKQKFPTSAYPEDFKIRRRRSFFSLQDEQAFSALRGHLPKVIKDEQEKVRKADLIIFSAPIYWSSLPSIMHGWIEQVLTPEFAYGPSNIFDRGHLKGKSAFFVMTHAGKLGAATDLGVPTKLKDMLAALHERPLQYSGIQTLEPISGIPPFYKSVNERQKVIDDTVQNIIYNVSIAATQNLTSKNKHPLIHLNGRPGVGKKTIGQLLAKMIKGKFIDNHTLLNPGNLLYGRGSDGYYRTNRKVRNIIYDEIAQALSESPIILSNALTDQVEEHLDQFEEVKLIAKKAQTNFIPILLEADFNENARRLKTPSRKKDLKLTDPKELSKLYKNFSMVSNQDTKAIDTTSLKASDSAKKLSRIIKKEMKP
jgi:NAD(P)H dehydrogenase (quinone)